MLAVAGALHVASSDDPSVEAERQEGTEAQKELEHAWYQKLMKEKEKQEWSEFYGLRTLNSHNKADYRAAPKHLT